MIRYLTVINSTLPDLPPTHECALEWNKPAGMASTAIPSSLADEARGVYARKYDLRPSEAALLQVVETGPE